MDTDPAPSQTELSGFLVDGVKDVIHRMIESRPEELPRFTTTTNSTTSIAKVGRILSVAREHDSTSILRQCSPIRPQLRYEATDSDSLHYRSKYNPGFYELNGSIFTVPEAGSGNNDIVVTQLFYDTGVAHGDEVPDNFPESYAYLVALYASVKSLEAAAGNKSGAQDIELQQSYTQLANSLKGEYMSAFQTPQQQQQPAGPPRR